MSALNCAVCRSIHGKTALELATTAELRAALQEPALQLHHVIDLPEVSTAVSVFLLHMCSHDCEGGEGVVCWCIPLPCQRA